MEERIMMTPSSPNCCPECGKPVPTESQHQVCPACLMAQALASRTIDVGPSAAPPPTPEEIAGKFPHFDILECLGRGGMGVVYKARQKSLNRQVAIKILAPERVPEARFAERFAREAELLAQLSHPHIVTIHDFGEADGLFYLVMEFVDGVNLRDLLRDGKLEPKQALAIVPPICEALQYAHDKGIVHRDIKPENLLLDRKGRVKIADFGIAALVGAGGEVAGTPPYMAPEQAAQSSVVDHRADIYALGVVLYEMLTGERPNKEFVAPSQKVHIDVRLDEIVLRALEKTPELRYQTAGEFRTVVETMAASPENPVVLPAQPGEAANPTKQVLRWMLFNERTGRRNFNWPFLLFFCSQIGLVVNGTILAITLIMWLLNVTPPHGKSFASPGEVWRMILCLAACVVMRQVALTALNLDSKAAGGSLLLQQTRNFKTRTVFGLSLVFLTSALLAGGVAFLFPWMHTILITVLAGSHLLTTTNTARVAVWIALSAALGLFIIRRFWRPVNDPLNGVADGAGVQPGSATSQSDINAAEWNNPLNWTGPKWFSVYFSKRDSRAWVPKQIPAMGWTVNLGNPRGAFTLLAIVVAIIIALTVVITLSKPGHSHSVKSNSSSPVIEQLPDRSNLVAAEATLKTSHDQIAVEDLGLQMIVADGTIFPLAASACETD